MVAGATGEIDLQELQGRILFGRAGGAWGDATIFTASIDGTDDIRIGGFLADKTTCCPRWSPDGSRIAAPALAPDGRFTTVLMDPNGTNHEMFTHPASFNGGCQIWSPNGERLACEGELTGQPESYGVYTVSSADGGDVQRVHTEERSTYVLGPMDFSPDGRQLLLLGEPVGDRDPAIDEGAPLGSLYVVNVDGTDLRRITPPGLHAWVQARWSPDGEWIVFGTVGGPEGGPLYLVRPDGSDLHAAFASSDGGAATIPEWSPDGEHILFTLNPPGTHVTLSVAAPNRLCIISVDGSAFSCILETEDQKTWPDWTH